MHGGLLFLLIRSCCRRFLKYKFIKMLSMHLGWVGSVTEEKNKLHVNRMRVLAFHRRGGWFKLEIIERECKYRVI